MKKRYIVFFVLLAAMVLGGNAKSIYQHTQLNDAHAKQFREQRIRMIMDTPPMILITE